MYVQQVKKKIKMAQWTLNVFVIFAAIIFHACCSEITDSYILCYHNNTIVSNGNNDSPFRMNCYRACFTFQSFCFCRSDFSWEFTSNPYPKLTNMTCENVLCKNDRVVYNSFTSSEYCVESQKSNIFEITDLVDTGVFDNFVQILPSQSLETFQELSLEVIYTKMEANVFLFDFDDGYKETIKEPVSKHVYTNHGSYVVMVNVNSTIFPNFTITKSISVNFNVLNATVRHCDSFNGSIGENFTSRCTASVIGGNEGLSVLWNFGEGITQNLSVLASTIFSPISTPCFHNCPESIKKSIPYYYPKIFHLPQSTFRFDGVLLGLEFYANQVFPSAKLQIYRPKSATGFTLVHSQDFQMIPGYNLVRFNDFKYIQQGDSVAFFMEDANFLQILETPGASMNIHTQSFYNRLVQPNISNHTNTSFHMRILACTVSNFMIEHTFKYTSLHSIQFDAHNPSSQLSSNVFMITEVANCSYIYKNDSYEDATVNIPYNICINIENAGVGMMHWSTVNSSVYEIRDGVMTPFTDHYDTNVVLQLICSSCIEVLMSQIGEHYFDFNITIDSNKTLSHTIRLLTLPKISLVITSPNNTTIYQLQEVTFQGTYDVYPYPLQVEWDYGNGIKENISSNNISLVYRYKDIGMYTVKLFVRYSSTYEGEEVLRVNVLKNFKILGHKLIGINQTITLTVESKISVDPSWLYKWDFGNHSNAEEGVNKTSVSKLYANSGTYQILLNITTSYGVIMEHFDVNVVDPIRGLHIRTKEGNNAFLNFNFSLEAVLDSGFYSALQYQWSSNDLDIVFTNHSLVTASSSRYGNITINVFVTNILFNATATFDVFISQFLVVVSSYIVEVGEMISFDIITHARANYSYEFLFKDNDEIIKTSLSHINRTFYFPGTFDIIVSLLSGSNKTRCHMLTVVPCNVTLMIDVEYAIKSLDLLYRTDQQPDIHVKDATIYSATKKGLLITIFAMNGTNVNFKMFLDGQKVRTINEPSVSGNHTAIVPLSKINFWSAGIYFCEVIVSNQVSMISKSYMIIVDDPVSGLQIVAHEYGEVNRTIKVTAATITGTNLVYEWYFRNQTYITKVPLLHLTVFAPGNYVITLKGSNPSSEMMVNKSVKVIMTIDGAYVDCQMLAAKTGKYIEIPFGYINGELVTTTFIVNGISKKVLFEDRSDKLDSIYKERFDSPGVYSINITFGNPFGLAVWKECSIKIQNIMNSVSMRIVPNKVLYIGDRVVFHVQVHGGTDLHGHIHIATQNHIVMDEYELSLSPCDISDCVEASVTHFFKISNYYHVHGTIENLVNSVEIAPQYILVIDSLQETQNYLEIVAESAFVNTPLRIHFLKKIDFILIRCNLKFGDGGEYVTKIFDHVIEHTYDQPGDYNISLYCLSDKGILNLKTVAFVQLPINVSEVVHPTSCILFGSSIHFSTTVTQLKMLMHIRVDVRVNSFLLPSEIILNERDIGITIQNSNYSTGENVEFLIYIRNYVSEVKKFVNICIKRAIQRITCQTPVAWRFGIPTPFPINIVSETSADLMLTYGDGITETIEGVHEQITTIFHRYNKTQFYQYNIQATNGVSTVWFNGNLEVIQGISNTTFFHQKKLAWPLSTIGFGVMFQESLSPTLDIKYNMYYGDGIEESGTLAVSNVLNNFITFASHVYKSAGCYKPTVMLSTKINSIVLASKVYITNFNSLSAVLKSTYNNTKSISCTISDNYLLGDDYPLQVVILNANNTCYTYHVSILNETLHTIGDTTSISKDDIVIDHLLNQPGVYTIVVKASLDGEVQNICNTKFTLIKRLPPLSLASGKDGILALDKEFVVLVESSPLRIENLLVEFGDSVNSTQYISNPKFLQTSQQDMAKHQYFDYYYPIKYSYLNIGSYKLTVTSVNQLSRSIASMNVFISPIHCKRPTVQILSSDNNKIAFYYRQQVKILSETSTDCGQRNQVLFSWSVYPSSLWEYENRITFSGKQALSFLSTDKSQQSSMIIGARTLNAGHYIVRLNVELEFNGLDNSDEIYLVIFEEDLQAKIEGGSVLQLPWQQDVLLNANGSNDPNEVSAQLRYEWYCVLKQPDNQVTDCFGNGLNAVEYFTSTWLIPKKVLLEGFEYIFHVVVTNNKKGRVAITRQSVTLIDQQIPILSISCQSNCANFVNLSNRLTLVGSCTNCIDPPLYKWSSVEDQIDMKNDTLSDPMSPYFVVKANVFKGDATYKFLLTVNTTSGVSSSAEYEVKTSRPPFGGSCNVIPKTGFALKTKYTIACPAWFSPLGSLNYRILVKEVDEAGKNSYRLLQYGPQNTSTLLLPSGDPGNNNKLTLDIEVTDLLGVFSMHELHVQVNPLTNAAIEQELQEELLNLTTGENNILQILLHEGKTQGLLQMISTITSILNTHKKHDYTTTNTSLQTITEQTEMRTSIARSLSYLPMQNYDNVKQTADAIGPLLQKPEEVSMETQEVSLKLITNVVRYMENITNVQLNECYQCKSPENIEVMASGIIKAIGNQIRALITAINRYKNTNRTTTSHEEIAQIIRKFENLTKSALRSLDDVVPLLLSGRVPGEQPTRVTSDTIALEVWRQHSNNIRNTKIETIGGGHFMLPKKLFDFGNESVVVDSKMASLSLNPFFWQASASNIKPPISSVSFYSENGTELPVKDLPQDEEIEYFLPQNITVSTIKVNSSFLSKGELVVYRIAIEQEGAHLVSRLNCPQNKTFQMFFARGKRPTLNSYDEMTVIECMINRDFHIFSSWLNVSAFYIGLKLSSDKVTEADSKLILNSTELLVEIDVFVVVCLYLNEEDQEWKDTGCRVGPQTTPSQTHCMCNHLTWLVSSFFIPPNSLDIKSEIVKLKRLDDYPALLATFCVFIGVSVVCMVWARRKDNRDVQKSEPIYLKSRSASSWTTYHIAIYTGHRFGSGTTATPTMIISGEEIDTDVITLKYDDRKLFDRGSVETFIYSTNKDLGEFKYITIWHDDGGRDPSWFLSRCIITNLNENKQFHFFCNDWLAVDQSDGKLNRVLPIATEKEMTAFENIFLARTARDLSDGHIWFSILTRPRRSNFTCLQRVVCCLCLILSTMLTNAMFYRVAKARPAGDEIDVSGFVIRWSSIMIGIQSALIVLPINFLIVFLFRRANPSSTDSSERKLREKLKFAAKVARPRREHGMSLFSKIESVESGGVCVQYEKHFPSEASTNPSKIAIAPTLLPDPSKHELDELEKILFISSTDIFQDASMFQIKEKFSTSTDDLHLSFNSNESTSEILNPSFDMSKVQLVHVQYWPYWVKYIAWVLCIVTSFVAGFFTLLYGLSFGKVGQEKWLFSFFISVFSDIMFNQPIKVIIFAAIVTLVVRKLKDDYILAEIENFRNVDWGDNEGVQITENTMQKEIHRPKPPSKSYIEMTRKRRIYEAKMVNIVVEIISYLFYLFLCLLITYGHRDPDAYGMTKNIESIFYAQKFDKVNSIPMFWNWTLDVLTPGLFNGEWYNGLMKDHKGFLNDDAALLLGAARMRQVRVKNESCPTNGKFGLNITSCGLSVPLLHKETRGQFCKAWNPCDQGLPLYPDYWRYRNSWESGSYTFMGRLATYPGGGYIVDIPKSKILVKSSLKYLMKTNWLDDYTRCVSVDFTIYNTNANFYVMATFLLEIPANGGAFVFKRILTTRLDRYSSGFAILLGACEVLFLCFSVYYMYREVIKFKLLRWRYFSSWQNYVEIVSFAFIWASFILLIIRFGVVSKVKATYLSAPKEFVNFETAALSDQMYGYMLAFVICILFIKFLKLLRFNRKMTLMFKTLAYASKDIRYFSITLLIVMCAYTSLSHLFYTSYLEEYSTILYTLESLLNLVLGSFDYYPLIESHPFLGKLFFASYVIVMTFILINMFISIINESFSTTEDHLKNKQNKYELMDFLTQRITGCLPAFLTSRKRPKIIREEKEIRIDLVPRRKPRFIAMNSQRMRDLQIPIKKCEAMVEMLDAAIDRITERVDLIIKEEKYEQKVWENVVELVQIKFPRNVQEPTAL